MHEYQIVSINSSTIQHKTLAGENFGRFGGSVPIRQSFIRQPTAKLWWIWQLIANPPKFSPPIFLQFQLRQSFIPPKFCAVRYISGTTDWFSEHWTKDHLQDQKVNV